MKSFHIRCKYFGCQHNYKMVVFNLGLLQYFSNSALAYTSVASTTVLTSTSGLFTLFFGAVIGKDSVNVTKIAAVLISLAGVAMTTAGKTWATDEMLGTSE